MRLFPVLLAALACVVSALPASAEPARRAVVVLDRGSDARGGKASDAGNALRIWKALERLGVDAKLLAAGISAGGDTRLTEVTPTRAGLAGLDDEPTFAFRGATDIRAALGHVLGLGGEGAVDLILIGPWSSVPPAKAKLFAGTVKRWNDNVPKGSRILSIGAGPGRGALASARGWAGDGRVVIGFDTPRVTTQGYSPLPPPAGGAPEPLEAEARVLGDVLSMGPPAAADADAPVLTLASDVAEDRFESRVTAGLHTWRIRRRVADGRTATLTFRRVAAKDVHWLGTPPEPLTFRWDKLQADARLVGPDGKSAAAFTAIDAEAGTPVSVALRLQRTLSGPARAWRVGGAERELPSGLSVVVGDEVRVSPEVGESEVRVRFEPQRGRPLDAKGAITLTADGMPEALRLPYEVRVQPGRVTWEVASRPTALPVAASDELTTIAVRAGNANAPHTMHLRVRLPERHAEWLRGELRRESGEVRAMDLRGDVLALVTVGTTYDLAFRLADGAPDDLVWPCAVRLSLEPMDGVELEADDAEVAVRLRQPRLVLQEPLREHRLEGATLLSEAPPVLTLDADGGDGDWLVALLETTPVVRVGGDAPIGWQAVPRGTGTWHLVPAGRWTGAEPGIFEDETLEIEIAFEWPHGAVPKPARIPVRVPARWGTKGFLLLGLAGLALVLALTVLGWMRTPPVSGTLLYTVDGLSGAVGRLDLAPVRRRAHGIASDSKGRLALGGTGQTVARIRPTRVGGMLEYTDDEGTRERRLLVDGLSLRIGRHLLRYVSGRAAEVSDADAPQDVPDLLGPEYDLESGRIDALGDEDEPSA